MGSIMPAIRNVWGLAISYMPEIASRQMPTWQFKPDFNE
jgi:hypothetical protein